MGTMNYRGRSALFDSRERGGRARVCGTRVSDNENELNFDPIQGANTDQNY